MQPIAQSIMSEFLDALASKVPAPGGGAAASVAGATASALTGMVLEYSVNRKSLAEHREMLESSLESARTMRTEMLRLGDEDAEAYAALNTLQKLDESDPQRIEHEPEALARATEIPTLVLNLAVELLELTETLVGKTNPYLRSDLAIAAVLAESAVSSAAWNVRINAPGLPEDRRDAALAHAEREVERARRIRLLVEQGCR